MKGNGETTCTTTHARKTNIEIIMIEKFKNGIPKNLRASPIPEKSCENNNKRK